MLAKMERLGTLRNVPESVPDMLEIQIVFRYAEKRS